MYVSKAFGSDRNCYQPIILKSFDIIRIPALYSTTWTIMVTLHFSSSLFYRRLVTQDRWDLHAANVIVSGWSIYCERIKIYITWDWKEQKCFGKKIQAVLWMNDAKTEAAAVATSESESKEKDQQCFRWRMLSRCRSSKNFTTCSVVLSFRFTFVKIWYRNLYNFLSPKVHDRLITNFLRCSVK